MRIKQTFFLTLAMFLIVWAFFAIDLYLGVQRREILSDSSGPAAEEDLERDLQGAAGPLGAASFEDVLALNLEEDFLRMLAAADHSAVSMQISEIDRQIQELEDMKRGFEARALRHDDQAQRLQFEDRTVLETRRHNELAEENRSKAARVQQEIDRLQVERRKLLQSE